MHRVDPLHGKSLVYDMNPVYGGIIQINFNHLSQYLLPSVPYDRIAIHRDTGITRIEHQRVANRLDIHTVRTHLVVAPDFAVHAIGIHVESVHLERIGVHVHRITLRIIYSYRTIRRHGITGTVVIVTIISCQHVLINLVGVDHITETFSHTGLAVIIQTVAHHLASLVGHNGTVEQDGFLCLSIVKARLGINMIVAAVDIGRTDNLCHTRLGIIVQRIGNQRKLRVLQLHIIIKHGLVRRRTILPPIGSQHIVLVYQPSSFEKISQFIQAVVIETVRIEFGFTMCQYHIVADTSQLVQTVIQQHVAHQIQCIPLYHLHMPESIE